MSFSYSPLTPICIEDPITQVNSVDKYGVLESGNYINWRPFTSTTISSSSINWSCPPPSNTIVNRSIKASIPIRLTFTGNVSTTNNAYQPATSLLNAGMDAPRFMSLSSGMQNLTVTLNGTAVSIPIGDVIHPLTRYNLPPDVMRREFSTTTATMRDQSFNYNDVYGTPRNPLAGYGNSVEGDQMSRGSYPFTVVSNPTGVPVVGGTALTSVVDMVLCENLFVSPQYVGSSAENNQGFYNLVSYDVAMTFITNFGNRAWSHNPNVSSSGGYSVTSNITNITVQFNGFSAPAFSYPQTLAPTLLFQYITPSPNTKQRLGSNIPITYPYTQIAVLPQEFPALAYGSAATIFPVTGTTLGQVPNSVIICARPTNSTLQSSPNYTDCYYAITNLQVTFMNQAAVLGSATQQQLYDIAVRNNICDSWNQFSGLGMYNNAFPPNALSSQFGGVGSVLMLKFGRDINLPPEIAPGVGGSFQFSCNVTLQNMNSSTTWDNSPINIVMIFIYEGTFTITSSATAEYQLNVLSSNDVMEAQTSPGITYNRVEAGRLGGGNFLSNLGDFASKVNSFLREHKLISGISGVLGNVPVIGPAANVVHQVSKLAGYGEGGCDNCPSGGVAIQGGVRMNKSQLRSRLG